MRIIFFFLTAFLLLVGTAHADTWVLSSYCSCQKCCGKANGIMASGKKVYYGAVACNWLPFGTKIHINGLGDFTVEDRGAKSIFGDKNNHKKRLDVYLPTHEEALRFGKQEREVEILR